uniref:Helicase/UvrB N-terminal domain-containing protein n=1 Tax=viral metagenome TaxID=1070528 RepID=A0A6C0EQ09_9ZZZZ
MSSLLEQLEVKPQSKTQQKVKIIIPTEGQAKVRAKPRIIDRTGEEFDRSVIMDKLKRRGLSVPKMKQSAKIRVLTEALSDTPEETVVEEVIKVKPSIKIKKLGKVKIRVSKNIKKGTITAIAKPGASVIKVKLPKKISLRRSQIPPDIIKFERELSSKLPVPPPSVNIRAGSYYRNNREIFVNFINSLFAPYKDELIEESKNLTCDSMNESKSGAFSLLTHQSIVRDYINLYTPYRGLLLYHGLGAGKTCASIAIAEGFQNPMHILVLTPASLRQNYQNKIKKCGNEMYRLNQYWEFLSNDNNTKKTRILAKMLSVSESFVKKHKGAWFVNVANESNYESLDTQEKFVLNE